MKKVTPYLFGLSAAGLTILLAGTVSYMILPPGSDQELPLLLPPDKAKEMATTVLNAKCADCHGENPGYSSFVNFFSGGMLKRDVENAQRAFTIKTNPDVRSAAVDFQKMDYVLRTRRMPPTRYSVVHWGSRLTPDDITVLRSYYSTVAADADRFGRIPNFHPHGRDEFYAGKTPIQIAMLDGSCATGEDLEKIILGHKLFFDTRLSTTNTVSCATCHDLTKGGTDNKGKSEGVPGPDGKPQLGGVNAPTVFNASRNIRQFWDGRAADLTEQAGGPPLNPVEMGYASPEDWAKIAEKLKQDPEMVELFAIVYPCKGINGETITDAIAAFERCLITPGSAFDRYQAGKQDALTAEQKEGLKHFTSYGCATCHGGPTLGGESFEYINTHGSLRAHAEGYKEGAFGRADFTKEDKHYDMFRVPNLRNVALTAPYFHTGTVNKLEDAVRIMFQTQVGTTPSDSKVKCVTAFLEAQTGTLGGKPLDKLQPEDVATFPWEDVATFPCFVTEETTPAPQAEPSEVQQPAVVEEPKPAEVQQPAVVEEPKPAEVQQPAVAEEPKPAEVQQPAVVEEPKPAEAQQPAVVEEPKPAEDKGQEEQKDAEPETLDLPRDIQPADGIITRGKESATH